MRGTYSGYLVVAAAAVVVGFTVSGTPVTRLLPFLAVLACPLMMAFMMRAMGGHGGQGGCGHDHSGHDVGQEHAGHGPAAPTDDQSRSPRTIQGQAVDPRR